MIRLIYTEICKSCLLLCFKRVNVIFIFYVFITLQASLHSVHSTAQRDGHMSARVMTLYGEGLLVVVTSEVNNLWLCLVCGVCHATPVRIDTLSSLLFVTCIVNAQFTQYFSVHQYSVLGICFQGQFEFLGLFCVLI